MTTRGWVLFGAMSFLWGIPYLLIKVAVDHLEPPIVVFGRTSVAGVVLLALAARTGAVRPTLAHWKPVLAFAAIEMAGPWLLLTNAEKHIPSGLAGLLVACVPIVAAVAAFVLGDRHALHPVRVLGIVIGLSGVALLVGRDLGGEIPMSSVLQVGLVCVGYAIAPFILSTRLADAPMLGVISLSLCAVALLYAPFAVWTRPAELPPADALWAMAGLIVICTATAFLVFFALIREVGPARATLFTFVNPAVAIVLGALVLDEEITGFTVAGFVLIIGGCWLATRALTPSVQPTPV